MLFAAVRFLFLILILLLVVAAALTSQSHATNHNNDMNNLQGVTIELHRAEFQHMDTNQNGHLESDEIIVDDNEHEDNDQGGDEKKKEDMPSEADVIAFIVELDRDGDGKVSWEEYKIGLVEDGGGPTMESFLPKEFENDLDGFVQAANDFSNERNRKNKN